MVQVIVLLVLYSMIDYRTFTLDNGLRVAHSCDPSTAMVAINLLYDTGARDENPGQTGIAHLFEHMMFGGSANVCDYSTYIEAAGGSDAKAERKMAQRAGGAL